MGLSIFYSLSLPLDASATKAKKKLTAPAAEARKLAKGTGVAVGKVRRLTDRDCAKAASGPYEGFPTMEALPCPTL